PSGRDATARMDQDFRKRGISPRGSGTILSAALFVLALEELNRSVREE
ncbi:MAG: triphosphoribosyl-dephospho-CoA synthase, partial [Synergistaceae bacterium]|nr:triphosphoribosyl-dephospho-CoA synthase [Synergistaceae bacterium]